MMNNENQQMTETILYQHNGQGQYEFDEVAIYFSKDEWDYLQVDEKQLYKDVMMENYRNIRSLGLVNDKPKLVSQIERGEELYVRVQFKVL
ncbi:KRAB domain-containing protein 5-like [Discoglossus pictus]